MSTVVPTKAVVEWEIVLVGRDDSNRTAAADYLWFLLTSK
jgi:hypothetical protein